MRNSSVGKANENERKSKETFASKNLPDISKPMEGFMYLTIKKAFFTNVTHKVPAHIDPSLPKIDSKDFYRIHVCVEYMSKVYKTKIFI